MKRLIAATLAAAFCGLAQAADNPARQTGQPGAQATAKPSTQPATLPYLPPQEVVLKALHASPMIHAAGSLVRAEEANRSRLEAGEYEWNVRLGSQRRRSNAVGAPDERFSEWNAGLERPLRLPGKATDDAALGAAGVALAETAYGDALHETSRNLLKSWFLWLRESAAASQWEEQANLLSRQAKNTRRRQQLGDAARLEAIQADAAQAQAEAQATQARLRRENAALELRRRFPGLPVSAPANTADPVAIDGSASEWIAAMVEHSHEAGIARGETQKARIAASRADRDRLPDPTVGLSLSSERGGEERIVGAYVSIPLPGGGRRAAADSSLAQASAASHREAAVVQKVSVEAATLHQSATAALAGWQAAQAAADRLVAAAGMTARAYELGEGSLAEVLAARRLANEAQLAASLARLDAFELRYRMMLDAHRLWADEEARQTAD